MQSDGITNMNQSVRVAHLALKHRMVIPLFKLKGATSGRSHDRLETELKGATSGESHDRPVFELKGAISGVTHVRPVTELKGATSGEYLYSE